MSAWEGSTNTRLPFMYNYTATPLVKLYAGAKEAHVSLCCRNCKRTPMEYMYLAHANYLPVDGGRIVYSAKVSPQTVRVRRSIPSHVSPGPDYLEFLKRLGERPEEHHILDASLSFDPELVFGIDYNADDEGWAHTLQVHPTALLTMSVTDHISYRLACVGSVARRTRMHWDWSCLLPPSRRAKRPKKPKAT